MQVPLAGKMEVRTFHPSSQYSKHPKKSVRSLATPVSTTLGLTRSSERHHSLETNGNRACYDRSSTGIAQACLGVDRIPSFTNGTRFSVPVHLNYGDRVVIVGSAPSLGSWAIDKGILLEWTDGDIWEANVDIEPGTHEFKCVVLSDRGLTWEAGPNRTITIPRPVDDIQVKCQMWDTKTTCVEPRSSMVPFVDEKVFSTVKPHEPKAPEEEIVEETEDAHNKEFDGAELTGLKLIAEGHIIPHKEKVEKGGEDAYFVSDCGRGALGVADGVGSWANAKIDPGEYPREFLVHAKGAFVESEGSATAVEAMAYGQYYTKVKGTSTACIAVMLDEKTLQVANLGDSGFRLVRDGAIIESSKVQEHEFNCPYQLGHPDYVPKTQFSKDADIYNIAVKSGDILIIASDGLFDNLWENDLEELVNVSMLGLAPCSLAAKTVATAMALAAHSNAQDEKFRSPWTVQATKEAKSRGQLRNVLTDTQVDNPYLGGKMDDCAVVVAFIN